MTDKITLATVGSISQNPTSAQTTINSNFSTIQTAFDNTLSRDGTSPNQMTSNIDMNNNRVLNLPSALTGNEPLRLQDLSTFTGGGTVTNIPSGGAAGQILTKHSNANYDVAWTGAGAGTVTSVGLAMPADLTVTGSPITATGTLTAAWATPPTGTGAVVRATSPTITTPTISSITNTGTLTLPTSTDTLVGRATTDTLTNKTINGSNNTLSNVALSSLATEAAYTLVGNTTGSAATPTAFTIPGLTQKVTPVSGDFLVIADSAASNALKYATVGSVAAGGTVASVGGLTGTIGLTASDLATSGSNIQLSAGRKTLPTTQIFTTGTGTYTTPANVLWIEVTVVGGGGGGAGSGTGTTGNAGTAGNASSFSTITCNGGGAGTANTSQASGAGGTATGGDDNFTGENGTPGNSGAVGGTYARGGGSAFFGGGGSPTTPGGGNTNPGASGVTNSGGGGSGASGGGSGIVCGAGGGGGGSAFKIINNPAATYSYTVGGTAAGGTAGTSGSAGGAGAAGYIKVVEHYN